MNKKLLIVLIAAFSLVSCTSQKKGRKLSEFRILNKKYNKWIVDRKPDFGLTGRDGCVVTPQVSLHIYAINTETIEGKVFVAETGEPLIGAAIKLFVEESEEPITITSDTVGIFSSQYTGEVEKIKVQQIGFSTLTVDLTELKVSM